MRGGAKIRLRLFLVYFVDMVFRHKNDIFVVVLFAFGLALLHSHFY